MYKRAMTILISFLSCCAMICVGFSAWTFNLGQDLQAESNGVIQSEDVIVSDDYVTISAEDMSNFVFTPTGFKSGSKATFNIKLKVFVEQCKKFVGENDLTVSITLSLSVLDDVNADYIFTNDIISFSMDDRNVSPSSTQSSYTAEFKITNEELSTAKESEQKELELSGQFTFTISNTTDYNRLYDALFDVNNNEQKNSFKLVVAVSNEPNEGN